MTAAQHSPEVKALIESGRLFPASDLLNSEKTDAPRAEAEVCHEKPAVV